MPNKTTYVLVCVFLLFLPANIAGGTISYAACMATVGVGGVVAGPAILTTVGFSSSGIAAGSLAASWMASYGGAVPAGSLFATLQSGGAGGIKWAAFGGISGFCDALTKPFP